MKPARLLLALVAFGALVAIMPSWVHYSSTYTAPMPDYLAFIVQFALPFTVLLYLGSHLQPGGS